MKRQPKSGSKRARTAAAKRVSAHRMFTEKEKVSIATMGIAAILFASFPAMSIAQANEEAERHIASCEPSRYEARASADEIRVGGVSAWEIERDAELTAEWLYGLSRKYGKFRINARCIEEGYQTIVGACYGKFNHNTSGAVGIVDDLLLWISVRHAFLLYLGIRTGEDSGIRIAACAALNLAVAEGKGAICWSIDASAPNPLLHIDATTTERT